jgi:Fic family protein
MADLERFSHDDKVAIPVLLKAALAHVQFETIHPFLDGNGRVGRLLIPLMLCDAGLLHEPLLFLSLYFKQNRAEYYERLGRVRTEGDWEGWTDFFLSGVQETATTAVTTAQRLARRFEEDRAIVQEGGRASGSAIKALIVMRERPLVSLKAVAMGANLSFPAAGAGVALLEKLGIARELTGRRRDRIFAYHRYLAILNEGTEPL